MSPTHYRQAASRREFLTRAGSGLAGIALTQMLQEDGLLAATSPTDRCCGICRCSHLLSGGSSLASFRDFASGGVS